MDLNNTINGDILNNTNNLDSLVTTTTLKDFSPQEVSFYIEYKPMAYCLKPFLSKSYESEVLISKAFSLSDVLINYFNPSTLLLLFTVAPQSQVSELDEDGLNKFYLITD